VPQQKELQRGGSKIVKARRASKWWQKWELEGKLSSPPPFLFFVAKKMTMMSPSFSSVSSCYKEEDDDDVVVVFFFFFFVVETTMTTLSLCHCLGVTIANGIALVKE